MAGAKRRYETEMDGAVALKITVQYEHALAANRSNEVTRLRGSQLNPEQLRIRQDKVAVEMQCDG